MRRHVTVTFLAIALMVAIAPQVHAQRTISNPSGYEPFGFTVATYATTTGVGSAAAVAIQASRGMVYGLTANAGANTAGVQVWANFFNTAAANVTPGTTTAVISVPVQAGGVSNTISMATIVPFGSPLGIPFSTAMSFNCTTTKNGTTGTQVPCNANLVWKP